MTHLRGKHVIITGGSLGIGAAVAREAFAAGARVSLIARRGDTLRATAHDISTEVNWHTADVTDSASVREAVDALEAILGPCDVLVCCAGLALPGRFLDVPADESSMSSGKPTCAVRSPPSGRFCRGWWSGVLDTLP